MWLDLGQDSDTLGGYCNTTLVVLHSFLVSPSITVLRISVILCQVSPKPFIVDMCILGKVILIFEGPYAWTIFSFIRSKVKVISQFHMLSQWEGILGIFWIPVVKQQRYLMCGSIPRSHPSYLDMSDLDLVSRSQEPKNVFGQKNSSIECNQSMFTVKT